MSEDIKINIVADNKPKEEASKVVVAEKPKEEVIIPTPSNEINFHLDTTKSVNEQAKDLVDLSATKRAVEDENLVNDVTNTKKEELKDHAETKLKEQKAENKKADVKLQEANFGIYKGIAELIGLKKPLPDKMLTALMVILMPILTIYYTVFGLVAGIINITMDGINAIVSKFAEFAKPVRTIIITLLIIAVVASILLVIRFYLLKYGIIS